MPEEPEYDYEQIMVCTREDDMLRAPIHGSVKEKCVDCGKSVWVSPASRIIMQSKKNSAAMCNKCAERHMQEDDCFQPLSEEQIKELKARMEH